MVCLNHSFPPPAIPPSLHQKPCRYLTPTLCLPEPNSSSILSFTVVLLLLLLLEDVSKRFANITQVEKEPPDAANNL